MEDKLIKFLSEYITQERLILFNKVIEKRTRYLTVVLEDIYQPQNASAVLRTCDCFGIQDVYIIENRNEFNINPQVELGSSKWLTLQKYGEEGNNSLQAIKNLKKNGYRIIATTPHKNDTHLEDFDLLKGKAALVFGSELPGISDIIANEADEYLKIPMDGFTESFNISVSAAIILHQLTLKLRNSSEIDWSLNSQEKKELKLEWLKNSIKRSDLLVEEFNKTNSSL